MTVAATERLLFAIVGLDNHQILAHVDAANRNCMLVDPHGRLHPGLQLALLEWASARWPCDSSHPWRDWSFQPLSQPELTLGTAMSESHYAFNALMIVQGHMGAFCTTALANAFRSHLSRAWDDDRAEFPEWVTRLEYALRSWAHHAPPDHRLWSGRNERNHARFQRTIPAAFNTPERPPPLPATGACTIQGSHVPPRPTTPSSWEVSPSQSAAANVISWNLGPTHLDLDKIQEVGALVRSAKPAVVVLQDAHRPQVERTRTLGQLSRACPDYRAFIGGTDATTANHQYPYLLITLVRKSLCPADNRAKAAELDLQWDLPDGRLMVVKLPAIPRARGETLLANV
ncbi:MAG TPA: hypothetical protein VLA31_07295 [Burkholderiaceae bacterium]|nr:hypothetical protein [Burkholderiaceae bacterium]